MPIFNCYKDENKNMDHNSDLMSELLLRIVMA